MHRLLICSMLLLSTTGSFAQKDKSKRPSPPAATQCSFADGKKMTIDYSQPSMKGRKIYGGLVPFNTEWRTGANEATTFVTESDVTIGDTKVPHGSYTLYTLPAEAGWKLIISKKTGQWGIPYPGKEFDLARIDMRGSKTEGPVEKLLISLKPSNDSCNLSIDWEQTSAQVDIRESSAK